MVGEQKETVGLAKGGEHYHKQPTPSKKEGVPKKISLKELGIDYKLSMRAQKLTETEPEEFEEKVGEWRKKIEEDHQGVRTTIFGGSDKHVRGTLGSGHNEWYTPSQYVEAAKEFLPHPRRWSCCPSNQQKYCSLTPALTGQFQPALLIGACPL